MLTELPWHNVRLKILSRNVGTTTRRVVNKGNRAKWDDVLLDKHLVPCLSDKEVQEVATTSRSLEERLGCAQDVEWTIGGYLSFPEDLLHLKLRFDVWQNGDASASVCEPAELATPFCL
jgi:hypothetical protein